MNKRLFLKNYVQLCQSVRLFLSKTNTTLSRRLGAFIVVLVTLIASSLVMGVYLGETLKGNFDQHFLPSKMFGVPDKLMNKGIRELYTFPGQAGWDGQFHYYIANDLFGLRDTRSHIDAPAYRYQRIGLPLLAKVFSVILLQNWVSPKVYYLTSLVLVLTATFLAALFFQTRKRSPYLILFWSVAVGTQMTMLNGLPDAAADSLLISSLVCLLASRQYCYVVFVTLAALSREAYIIFPIALGVAQIISIPKLRNISWFTYWRNCISSPSIVFQGLPLLVFSAWHLYVRIHFGVAPSEQADGIIGVPLKGTIEHLVGALRGHHLNFPVGVASYMEGIGIAFFLLLLLVSSTLLARLVADSWKNRNFTRLGIAVGYLILIGLYLCLGPAVMGHFTGYMKAANIFMFVVPFSLTLMDRPVRLSVIIFLIVLTAFFAIKFRDSHFACGDIGYNQYTGFAIENCPKKEPAGLTDFSCQIKIKRIELPFKDSLFNRFFMPRNLVLWIEVSNSSKESFHPYPGKGAVNVSWRWLDEKGQFVVRDGIRTWLGGALTPGSSTTLPVVVEYPALPGNYILRISLVQEGYAWFYTLNPACALDICFSTH